MTKRQQGNVVILFIGIFILMASGYNSFLKPLDNAIINFIKGFSQLRRRSLRNKKPPAMRVRDKS